ncbi:MAG TPA: EAL domain-containing protein, partial [Wenzhouxiangella sp.]|nr:EAL domain-containing protein [Wenzhouxiangella sp.]
VITDISERKEAEREVHRLAHYDTLTNLPNRTLFHIRIGQVLSQAQRHNRPVAVMFIDLDRFKLVNDSLGHGLGDQLLIAVAERLVEQFRDYDVISRQGGDEFLLVLPETDADRAARRAEELLRNFAEQPFDVDGHKLTITPSIGIAMFPYDAEEADALIQHADAAMYHAKEQGRATFQFFTEELNTRVHHRLQLENHLRGALARDELALEYQPVIDLESGRIVSVEALLRWRSPTLGQVPPSDFIPVAEQSGLIVEIGDWVIEAACRQLARWRDQGMRDIQMAVNVSAMQLWRGNLFGTVNDALRHSGVLPSQLVIELTESVIMEDVTAARKVLAELKELGVALAIDDFGTGYSSLGYLKQFRIDLLKIDRSFVEDIAEDADDAAIVTAMLSISEDLRMEVVAEGIEHGDQLEFLRSRGCRFAQGFLFSRPVGPERIPDLVATFELGRSSH